jgi:uncharacterized protein (TIGR02266 family)
MGQRAHGRRHLARLDLAIRVRVSCDSEDAFSTHFSQNLSADGIFVRTTTPRPVGSELELEYVLPDGTVALRGKGVVRWARSGGANEVGPTGMGVELLEVDERGRRFLASVLMRHGAATPAWLTAIAATSAARPFPVVTGGAVKADESAQAPAAIARHAEGESGAVQGPVADGAAQAAGQSRAPDPSPLGAGELLRRAALLIDLSGPELVSAVAVADGGKTTTAVPSSLTPRLVSEREGLRVRTGGLWVPCLVPLASLGWPSPTAALWARRFGLPLGGDGAGGTAIMLGGRLVSATEALAVCLGELVEPYANSDILPPLACVVLPPGTAPAVPRAVEHALAAFGLRNVEVIIDAIALVASTPEPRPSGPVLVVQTSLLETRVAVVLGGGTLGSARSALDTGLWRADDIVADQLAVRLLVNHGLTATDEHVLRRDLVAAVAAARAESQGQAGWRLQVGEDTYALSEAELRELGAAASVRVLLACEEALGEAGLRSDALGAVLIAADEPPWPGLVDAVGEGLSHTPRLVGTHVWCRLEGAAALASAGRRPKRSGSRP